MNRWSIQLPVASPSDSLTEMTNNARVLSAEDREITTAFLSTAGLAGVRTAQQAQWLLEDLGTDRRRALDTLRERCGRPTTGQIEARERVEQACRACRQDPWYFDVTPDHVTGIGAYADSPAAAARQAASDQARAQHAAAEHEARAQHAAAVADTVRPQDTHFAKLLT